MKTRLVLKAPFGVLDSLPFLASPRFVCLCVFILCGNA